MAKDKRFVFGSWNTNTHSTGAHIARLSVRRKSQKISIFCATVRSRNDVNFDTYVVSLALEFTLCTRSVCRSRCIHLGWYCCWVYVYIWRAIINWNDGNERARCENNILWIVWHVWCSLAAAEGTRCVGRYI